MKYGVALWGTSMDIYKVFKMQKKAVWIVMGINSRISGRPIFKTLKTLTVPFQYMLSLMTFLAYNLEYLMFINTLQCKYTWRGLHFHLPWGTLTYRERCSLFVFKVFNNGLPKYTADSVKDKNQFSVLLRNF